MEKGDLEEVRICSFCFKTHEQVEVMVQGPVPSICICGGCIAVAVDTAIGKNSGASLRGESRA